MRFLALLLMLSALLQTTPAEARLFWQLYGSVTPQSSDGSGCSWNWNQDFFVPRHSTSGRYDLFSPCKEARTTSPACRWCHRFFPGYCSVYRPCHYVWRNYVYRARCGCAPVQPCCGGLGYPTGALLGENARVAHFLPGVELGGFEMLGGLPFEENDLAVGLEVDGVGASLPGLPGATQLPALQSIPVLNLQQLNQLTQPLPTPAGR